MAIELSDEEAQEMASEIGDLMHNWSPNNHHADYQCEWCKERPHTNQGDIAHKPDCRGKKYLKLLQPGPID